MPIIECKTLREDWELVPRLSALLTEKSKLLRVRATAVGAAADATPFHPANAAGTLSYQYGTFSLRYEHVNQLGWEAERPDGVEAIKNQKIRVRIAFANVDVACNDEHLPRARSAKGAGAERICAGNGLFDYLPRYTVGSDNHEEWATYYLMVAPNGAAELSRASVKNGQFSGFVERLYLSDGSDLDIERQVLVDDGPVEEFDPRVVRK